MDVTEKILKTIEEQPSGLSISEWARKSGAHRNTISQKVGEWIKEGKIKYKMVGKAKVFYMPEHQGLHNPHMPKGKNIHVGIGVSNLEDGYKAGIEAAQQAAKQAASGEYPTFSVVFVSSEYNPQIQQVVKGINRILGTEWIGCTTDRELNSVRGYSEGTIEVLSLHTKYLHFGVEVADNYREDPFERGREAITKAIEKAPVDRAIDSTVQYIRSTKKSYADIVKNPPYFILTLIGGAYYKDKQPVPGMETEFLEGIFDAVGSNIPILGASASSDVIKFTQESVGENYQFANGKVYENAAIVAFVVSDLYFSYGLEHGYKQTPRIAQLTKLSNNGRVIEEINDKGAVEEYCRLIGVDQEEFLKNPWNYTLTSPLAIVDTDGKTYIKTIGPNPDGKTLYSLSKLIEKSNANILSFDEESVINVLSDVVSQAGAGHEDKDIAFLLVFTCSARRVLLGDKVNKALEAFKSKHGDDVPIFGFYTFGEVGSRRNRQSQCNNQTVTVVGVYDHLLTQ